MGIEKSQLKSRKIHTNCCWWHPQLHLASRVAMWAALDKTSCQVGQVSRVFKAVYGHPCHNRNSYTVQMWLPMKMDWWPSPNVGKHSKFGPWHIYLFIYIYIYITSIYILTLDHIHIYIYTLHYITYPYFEVTINPIIKYCRTPQCLIRPPRRVEPPVTHN